VNKNAIPNDPEKPFVTSGIRVGTAAVTTRGFQEAEMQTVGKLICAAAHSDFQDNVASLQAQVKQLTARFPLYEG
jgi:glycine hydroxymethyltransferase